RERRPALSSRAYAWPAPDCRSRRGSRVLRARVSSRESLAHGDGVSAPLSRACVLAVLCPAFRKTNAEEQRAQRTQRLEKGRQVGAAATSRALLIFDPLRLCVLCPAFLSRDVKVTGQRRWLLVLDARAAGADERAGG